MTPAPHRLSSFLFIVLLSSCASTATGPGLPAERPLGREIAVRPAPSAEGETPDRTPAPEPAGSLSLGNALAAALLGNPSLASATLSITAAEARALQAGLLPNPELGFEVEEFGGEGELSGFDVAEYTLSLSQTIPVAGKLGKRESVSRLESRLAGWGRESTRLDVLTETTKAFISVLAAQDRVGLERESVEAAGEVLRTVREQVGAGKSAELEERKAAVEFSLSRLRLQRAVGELEAARQRLAANWGASGATFDRVKGDLGRTHPLPSPEAVSRLLAENPDLAQWEDVEGLERARVDSARAEAWPDVILTGGVKRFDGPDLYAFLAGISFSLPVFDRNQGGIRAALAEKRRAVENRRAAVVRVETDFVNAWQALVTASRQANTLREDVLPAARAAFEASQEGFRHGKFGYLDVLDAQRTLFVAREELIAALAEYHHAVADVERLVGRSLSSLDEN